MIIIRKIHMYIRSMKEHSGHFCAAVLIMVVLVSLVSCSKPASSEKLASPEKTHTIIIDSDSGADDAAAIILAAKDSSVTIEGVTVTAGNVDLYHGAENVLMSLEMAGVSVPVYKGAAESISNEPFEPYSVFGTDGMGDADLIHPSGKAEDKSAVDFILETVGAHPGEIEIFEFGPATNIANAILKDPETMKKVKMIWCLGTAGLGPGNATPVAEFNVYADAEAYKIMLDSGIPITVIGFDMCGGDAEWTDKQFSELEASGDTGLFIAKALEKIREFYKSNGDDAVSVCDPEAVMCALDEDFMKESIDCHASCITERGETYGEVIFYKKGFTYDLTVPEDLDYNVRLVTDVDKAGYFDRYLKAIS